MKISVLIPFIALSACASPMLPSMLSSTTPAAVPAPTLDPTPPPPPPASARTVEQFDTTTAEDRAAALAPAAPASSAVLGTTIASLGSPTEPGIWLKTPLVTELQQGHIAYPSNGRDLRVELRPSGGAVGSGSQISLAAMRLIDAPLTSLPELTVSAE